MTCRRLIFAVLITVLWAVSVGAAGTSVLSLSPQAVVDLALERSFGVKQAELTKEVVAQGVGLAKGTFDTHLGLEGSHEIDKSKRESPIFGTRIDTTIWNLGLSKELPIGTELGLAFTNVRKKTTGSVVGGIQIIPPQPLYEPVLGFSLSQPLMRNVFGKLDRGAVKEARLAYASADFATQRSIDLVVHQALADYWALVFARMHSRAMERSVRAARDFLNATLEKRKLGTAEDTDELAARANLMVRNNELLALREVEREAAMRLRLDLELEPEISVETTEKGPAFVTERGRVEEKIKEALERRGDYLSAKKELERRNVRLSMAKNVRWPRMDLYSTLELNEIDTGYGDAVSGMDSPDWKVGLNFSVPLENRRARAGVRRAAAEKAIAVYALKDVENQVANEVSVKDQEVLARRRIVEDAETALDLHHKKLRLEMAKYRQGRSSSEMIILYQDDVVAAQRARTAAWWSYRKAVLDLELAQATIVD